MQDDSKGPPKDVLDHLIDVHTLNGTLDRLLASGIGDSVEEQLVQEAAYMEGFSPAVGSELFRFEGGTTVSLLADINVGTGSSNPGRFGGFVEFGGFIEFGGDLYFTARDSENGFELRKLSGTDGSVTLVDDIATGVFDSAAGRTGFFEFGGDLYFSAGDQVHGLELRKLSGTEGTVSLVADINSGSGSSLAGFPSGFVEFGGDIYFTAFDSENGRELRKLSGTDGSVSLVADINIGSAGSNPSHLIVFDGDLYFTAFDSLNGFELRKLDGATGVIETFDFAGAESSAARVLGVVNDTLAIQALLDTDGDGQLDSDFTMLASAGEPTSVADFQIVDDGSGAFVPGPNFYVSDSFFIA